MRYGYALVVLVYLGAEPFLGPADVYAQGATQASITGIIRDGSGAVLPGVAVEASSTALIERVRSGVSDGTGRFRIVSLPPGIYDVTFTLTGFMTVKRERVELSGSFTATIDVEMNLGQIEETVTVTGESPIIDVQNTQSQQVINSEVLSSIPANRSFEHLAALVPGIQLNTNAQNVGGINGPVPPFFGGHGGSGFEGRLRMDGIGTGGATGGVSLLIVDTGNAAEITVSTTGGLADAEIGGPEINVVPRTGGNTFSGQLFLAGANGGHAERQLHAGVEGRGPARPVRARQGVGRQRRRRRADRAGSVVVLRHGTHAGKLRVDYGHVLQRQRRRSDQVDLRAGLEPAVVHGRRVEELVAAADVAGDAAQQVHRVLGRAGRVPFLRRRRQSNGGARGVGAHRRPVDARVSGGVDRTAVEQIAGRGRDSRGWDSATAASAPATTGTSYR